SLYLSSITTHHILTLHPHTLLCLFFFSTDPPPTEIYTLSLHDALPISAEQPLHIAVDGVVLLRPPLELVLGHVVLVVMLGVPQRSEEHTSELQSRGHLVCRLLLEKKKKVIYR